MIIIISIWKYSKVFPPFYENKVQLENMMWTEIFNARYDQQ